MAFAEVGAGSQRNTVTGSAVDFLDNAFPANVAAGSLLIVAGRAWSTTGGVPTVTDTVLTSYTVVGAVEGNFTRYIAYGVSPSAGANTVRVNHPGTANYSAYAIDEFSGQHAAPLDVDGGVTSGSGTAVSDTLTTVETGDLIVGLAGWSEGSNTAITPGADYTQIGEYEDNLNIVSFNAVFAIVSAAQLYTVDWTLAISRSWTAMTLAFKPAAAGGASAGPLIGPNILNKALVGGGLAH